jgi:uncharacterized membrane protein (UPF0127 family)
MRALGGGDLGMSSFRLSWRVAAFVCCFFLVLTATLSVRAQQGLEKLDIVTSTGTHTFSVEVMRTEEQRETGLMFRRFLPADRGMLFDFEKPQPVIMWMKNTILSLDMVFIGSDGRVLNVAESTEPMSERLIPSHGPVLAVLEVNAGTAANIGLHPGDRVVHPMFGKK